MRNDLCFFPGETQCRAAARTQSVWQSYSKSVLLALLAGIRFPVKLSAIDPHTVGHFFSVSFDPEPSVRTHDVLTNSDFLKYGPGAEQRQPFGMDQLEPNWCL